MENIAVDKCPHCSSDYGYYRICYMKGKTEYHHNFEGKNDIDNSHIHDGLTYKENKKAFCCQCNKEINKLRKK